MRWRAPGVSQRQSEASAGPRSPPPRRPGARSPGAGSAQSAGHRTGSLSFHRYPGRGWWSAWQRKTRSKQRKPETAVRV